jgi:hypothetical protein
MKTKEILKRLDGVQTIESVMSILGSNKTRAVYAIHRLRKEGYVKTLMAPDRRRVYYISFENKLGGTSYYQIINSHSPVKLSEPETYKIYGREVSLEETLIFAVKSRKLRLVLASLALFRDINNWSLLYKLAKANRVERKVGALYDLSKKIMRVRRMNRRIRGLMLPKDNDMWVDVIEGFGSSDFMDVENLWKVRIPFNRSDLEDYK